MNQPEGVQNFPPIYTTGNMTQFNNHPPSSVHGQTNSYYQYPAQQQTLSQMPSFCMSPPGTAINLPPVRPTQPVLGTVYPVQASMGFKRLLAEMKLRQFDTIRFAAYRTASKLRYIQQRTLFRFMELGRVVETFREFGLHQLNDPNASLDYAGTARILARIYSQLSGPTTDVQTKSGSKTTPSFDPNVLRAASEILLSFLIYALDVCATARLTVNSLKIALSTLTNAKPSEKFR
ncbi:Dystrobrevin-1, partial [Clonorchis sinensis]